MAAAPAHDPLPFDLEPGDPPNPSGPFPNAFTPPRRPSGSPPTARAGCSTRPDGTPITPGNFSSTGGEVRQKPDITAADGVLTRVDGFDPFFGTSAAAPHAAAIAALVLSGNPGIDAGRGARGARPRTAIDLRRAGVDARSGHGVILRRPGARVHRGEPAAAGPGRRRRRSRRTATATRSWSPGESATLDAAGDQQRRRHRRPAISVVADQLDAGRDDQPAGAVLRRDRRGRHGDQVVRDFTVPAVATSWAADRAERPGHLRRRAARRRTATLTVDVGEPVADACGLRVRRTAGGRSRTTTHGGRERDDPGQRHRHGVEGRVLGRRRDLHHGRGLDDGRASTTRSSVTSSASSPRRRAPRRRCSTAPAASGNNMCQVVFNDTATRTVRGGDRQPGAVHRHLAAEESPLAGLLGAPGRRDVDVLEWPEGGTGALDVGSIRAVSLHITGFVTADTQRRGGASSADHPSPDGPAGNARPGRCSPWGVALHGTSMAAGSRRFRRARRRASGRAGRPAVTRRRSRRSTTATTRRCCRSAGTCWATARTPRTRCSRPSCAPIGRSAGRLARPTRCGPGSTRSRAIAAHDAHRAPRRRRARDEIEPSFDGLSDDVRRRAELRELVADLGAAARDQRVALVVAELGTWPRGDRDGHRLPARVRSRRSCSRRARRWWPSATRAGLPCDEIRGQLEVASGGRAAARPAAPAPGQAQRAVPRVPARGVSGRRGGLASILPIAPTAGLKGAVLGGGRRWRRRRGGGDDRRRRHESLLATGGGLAIKAAVVKVAVTVAVASAGVTGGIAAVDGGRAADPVPVAERVAIKRVERPAHEQYRAEAGPAARRPGVPESATSRSSTAEAGCAAAPARIAAGGAIGATCATRRACCRTAAGRGERRRRRTRSDAGGGPPSAPAAPRGTPPSGDAGGRGTDGDAAEHRRRRLAGAKETAERRGDGPAGAKVRASAATAARRGRRRRRRGHPGARRRRQGGDERAAPAPAAGRRPPGARGEDPGVAPGGGRPRRRPGGRGARARTRAAIARDSGHDGGPGRSRRRSRPRTRRPPPTRSERRPPSRPLARPPAADVSSTGAGPAPNPRFRRSRRRRQRGQRWLEPSGRRFARCPSRRGPVSVSCGASAVERSTR